MFGYLTPVKPQMRICEYDLYKAAYCGLSYELQQHFGYFSKLFLNYDFVFVSMLGRSSAGIEPQVARQRCNTNCLKRCQVQQRCEIDRYCAAALIATAFYKLTDDLADERLFKRLLARLALPIARRGCQRARERYPDMVASIERCMADQLAVEAAPYRSVDAAADSTAVTLGGILQGLSQNEGERRILQRLGYLLGRFIYLADAADDFDDDLRRGRYNPLALEFPNGEPEQQREAAFTFARQELRATASEIAGAYVLLDLNSYHDILDNIVYLGLNRTIARLGQKKGKKHDQSL